MWRRLGQGAPELSFRHGTLRELRADDAPTLLPYLHDRDVQQQMNQYPRTLSALEAFIAWTCREREAGRHLCVGIIPAGQSQAVGMIQLWPIEQAGRTAEFGFMLGRPFWGRSLFYSAAAAFVDYAVATLGVTRLEARARLDNTRGNAALLRLGAVREGVLRDCFIVDGEPVDYGMWSILARDWQRQPATAALPLPPATERSPGPNRAAELAR